MKQLVSGILCLLFAISIVAATPASEMKKSVVRITVTEQEPNYKVPWVPGSIGGGVGAGFVIDAQRIMTNAHVVSNARYLSVSKEDDPKQYLAHVEFVGHDCDLAVIKIDDPNFFKGTAPLKFGGIPEIESGVSVYGYPIGGDRMSVTNGVISRIDFQTYSHSGVDSHLTIQTSAAINPGNSGGPVLQNGKVVGVAFQGYSGDVAQNVGYMIPVPVIERFLKDITDGHYDKYMDLSVTTFKLQNPAMRKALGLADADRGTMVSAVATEGCSDGVLQTGDVLLEIDGHPIASDAFVDLDGDRVQMEEIVERKFKGDSVKIKLLRDKKEKEVEIKLGRAFPYLIQGNTYDVSPRFVLFGGLLFQPLGHNFMDAYQIEDLRVRFCYDFYVSDEMYKDHPELVILSAILPDPINTYLTEFRNGIVDEINGVKIKTLNDVSAEFARPAEKYVIKLIGVGRPLVLECSAVESARERILRRYNVSKEQNLSE
ncbi:MAG: trypsin-like peptidase domain-containing protein [Verrucomicrobiota bacterium]